MSNETYRSTGTIRIRSKSVAPKNDTKCVKCGCSQPQWTTEIFFTPNADSTVRNRGKQYAVFIGGDNFRYCLQHKVPDSGEGISITDHHGLVAAATQQTLVEVEGKNSEPNLVLRAIAIPASSKKK